MFVVVLVASIDRDENSYQELLLQLMKVTVLAENSYDLSMLLGQLQA